MQEKNRQAIKAYYVDSRESRWGYKYLLKGTKHYGYYPDKKRISVVQSQLEMEKLLGKALGLKKGAYVLDAGCGEGWVAIHLNQTFGYKTHGIDLLKDPSIIKAIENRDKLGLGELEFEEMDYSNLDFPDDTFDGVYTIETLVHSPDYKKTLKEFYRVLKPGGVLVNFEYAMDDDLREDVQEIWDFIYKEGSMHTLKDFRMGKMIKNWQAVGFENVSMTDISENMRLFMRFLYRVALTPYSILKLFHKERQHLNTYVGVKSYQRKQRETFHYVIMKAFKPGPRSNKRR